MSSAHVLYRHYDASDRLLYVGITHDPGKRWQQHRGDKPWWQEVCLTRIEHFGSRADVLAAEKAAIIAERPRWNIANNADGLDYWKRVEHAAREFQDSQPVSGPMFAALHPAALEALRRTFRETVSACADRDDTGGERIARVLLAAVNHDTIALDRESGLPPGSVYEWGQFAAGEAFRFAEVCEEHEVGARDALAEYLRITKEGEL